MAISQFNFPTTIRFGAGAVKELPDYLSKNNLKSPLVVTDPNVAQLPFFKEIVADLQKNNINVEIFSDIHKNPVKSDVYKGVEVWDSTNRDSVIGIGGGAGPGGVKAVAPSGSEFITMELPADVGEQVSVLGEKLSVVRPDAVDNFATAGRPIASISNVMLEYRPGPPPKKAPAGGSAEARLTESEYLRVTRSGKMRDFSVSHYA